MSKRIIAIDLSEKKRNIFFDTRGEARKNFVTQPLVKREMSDADFRKVLLKGTPVYHAVSHGAYCVDELQEPEGKQA